MDGMSRGFGASQDASSHLFREGVILWHLTFAGQSHLWCLVVELSDGLYFLVDDDPQGPKPSKVQEQHADIICLMDRAEALKSSLLGCGWLEVDVE
jgi:hypothetical protein